MDTTTNPIANPASKPESTTIGSVASGQVVEAPAVQTEAAPVLPPTPTTDSGFPVDGQQSESAAVPAPALETTPTPVVPAAPVLEPSATPAPLQTPVVEPVPAEKEDVTAEPVLPAPAADATTPVVEPAPAMTTETEKPAVEPAVPAQPTVPAPNTASTDKEIAPLLTPTEDTSTNVPEAASAAPEPVVESVPEMPAVEETQNNQTPPVVSATTQEDASQDKVKAQLEFDEKAKALEKDAKAPGDKKGLLAQLASIYSGILGKKSTSVNELDKGSKAIEESIADNAAKIPETPAQQ